MNDDNFFCIECCQFVSDDEWNDGNVCDEYLRKHNSHL